MKFDKLNLNLELINGLKEINFENATPIQEKTIPQILNNKNILGIAQTGTGKTGAFAIPIIELLLKSNKITLSNLPKVIILAPTKELVIQITGDIKNISKYTKIKSLALYGGISIEEQIEQLKNKIEIIISTPERLYDLLKNKNISLNKVEYFVLDEVDKMLNVDSSFYVKKIIKILPKIKQSIFFSATVSSKIEELINEISKYVIKVKVSEEKINTDLIEQFVMFTKFENKYKLLLDLLKKKEVKSAIIFTNSRKESDNLVRFLSNNDIHSEQFHAQKSTVHRLKVINNIKSKKTKFLIATDLLARGLDIPDLTHIINFEIPTNEEVYIHRIGRTARLNKSGIAYSFCSPSERNFLEKIEKLTNNKLKIISHEFHSEFAKNVKGKNAKPKFKRVKKFSKKNKQEKSKNLFPLIRQK